MALRGGNVNIGQGLNEFAGAAAWLRKDWEIKLVYACAAGVSTVFTANARYQMTPVTWGEPFRMGFAIGSAFATEGALLAMLRWLSDNEPDSWLQSIVGWALILWVTFISVGASLTEGTQFVGLHIADDIRYWISISIAISAPVSMFAIGLFRALGASAAHTLTTAKPQQQPQNRPQFNGGQGGGQPRPQQPQSVRPASIPGVPGGGFGAQGLGGGVAQPAQPKPVTPRFDDDDRFLAP